MKSPPRWTAYLAWLAVGCAPEEARSGPPFVLGAIDASIDASRAAGGFDGGPDAAARAPDGDNLDATTLRDANRAADATSPPQLARNVIIFMGDGMGPEQLSTGRYVKQGSMRIDTLSGPALANTDSLTTLTASEPARAPTDSAAGATAIATGVLVDNGALSLTREGAPLETVLEVCKRAGKATGLVTTSYFFDASPAAFASHQPSRGDYPAIARQMLMQTTPDVIMGDGAWVFDDASYGLHEVASAAGYFVVRGVSELNAWNPTLQPRMLGLFSTDFVPATEASELFSMTPALERRPDSPDPTLASMTARALERLATDPDGFFLFAEDEIFDEIGHRGPAEVPWANRAYPQQVVALDEAIGVAIDWVQQHSSFDETLIVLLADHETGGYQYDHSIGPSSGFFNAFIEGSTFRWGNHTRTPIAVYALGPGSDSLLQVHSHADTHRLLIGALR
jgi:alkaline phosphatase